MIENKLYNGLLDGDILCQSMFFNKYFKIIRSLCGRFSNNSDIVDDLVQESFIKIYKSIKNFNRTGSVESYILAISYNVCLDYIKGLKRKNVVQIDSFDDLSMYVNFEELVDDGNEEHNEFIENLSYYLLKLPNSQKEAIKLFFLKGMSHEEISKQLNISVGTSKSNLHKAKEKIKEILKQKK